MSYEEAYKEITSVCYGMDRDLQINIEIALIKQIPKKPILDMARHRVECSVCHYSVAWYDKKDGGIGGLPYCNICGQKIDWGE